MLKAALWFALAVPASAAAQRIAPAFEADAGYSHHAAGGDDALGLHARAALGVQVGPVAAMGIVERMVLQPGDSELDSEQLEGSGKGFAVRVEAWRRRDRFAHISGGVTWYSLEGDDEVTRTCDEFGTCLAGWYFERPAYSHVGVHIAGSLGFRSRNDIWSGIGLRLGLTHFSIDRPGTGPDADGVLVRLSLITAVGGR